MKDPVHPTSGAFWGMGIGIGCGVGWGPGFGPEVIGYVGSGCGVGFSVGITLAGFGIGLPANYVFEVPYSAFMATRSGALEFARSSGLLSAKNVTGNGLSNIVPSIAGLQRKVSGRFSSFKHKDPFDQVEDLSDMKSVMSSHTRSIVDNLQKFVLTSSILIKVLAAKPGRTRKSQSNWVPDRFAWIGMNL